jgi:ATP-binding protein involved in chromosome partitioning
MAEPTKIEVEGGSVRVEWDDGRSDVMSAAELRLACPCAGCREPGVRERLAAAGLSGVSVTGARLVGGYAVGFTFGPDGHATGIYSFSLLRTIGEPT